MPYPKFEGLFARGKRADFLISQGYFEDAVVLLQRAEQALVIKRRRLKQNSKNFAQMKARYDKALGLIGEALRGDSSLLDSALKSKEKRLKKARDRNWYRRTRR